MALRAAALLLAATLAAGAACSGDEEAARPTPPPAGHSVLAIAGGKLVAVDPFTLRPVGEKDVEVGRYGWPWAFSPDRSLLALTKRRSVRVVNLRGAGVADIAVQLGFADHLAWPTPRRLIVVQDLTRREEVRFLLLDPIARDVLARRTVPAWQGWPLEVVSAGEGVVALVLPRNGIGAARVAVFDMRGRLRVVRLPSIRAGSEWAEIAPGYDATREIWPGLAADPSGSRAFVFGADDVVADVDLRTMEATYARLREDRSLLGRLRDRLEPEAQAKVSEWHQIRALWLGDGRVALFGRRSQPYVSRDGGFHERDLPLGLRIVETRDWTFRVVDASVASIMRAGEVLLASSWLWDSEAQEHHGIGLRAYTRTGERLFHVLDRRPIFGIQVAGAYAHVAANDEDGIAEDEDEAAVVDLRSGEVVRRRPVEDDFALPLLIRRE